MPRKKRNAAAARAPDDYSAVVLDRFDALVPPPLTGRFMRAAAEPQTWQSAWVRSVQSGQSRLPPDIAPAVMAELCRQYAAMNTPPPGSHEHFEDLPVVCMGCGLRRPNRLPVPGGFGNGSCPACGDGEFHHEHAPPKDAPWRKLAAAEPGPAPKCPKMPRNNLRMP